MVDRRRIRPSKGVHERAASSGTQRDQSIRLLVWLLVAVAIIVFLAVLASGNIQTWPD
jgi:uncharacterized membrane protein